MPLKLTKYLALSLAPSRHSIIAARRGGGKVGRRKGKKKKNRDKRQKNPRFPYFRILI